jgi:uncharacterized protein
MELPEIKKGGNLLDHVLAFGLLLREMGVDVSPGQMLELVQALEHVPIHDRQGFKDTCRCLLVLRREDLLLFEQAFTFFWRRPGKPDGDGIFLPDAGMNTHKLRRPRPKKPGGQGEDEPKEEQEKEIEETVILTYSAIERLRGKDFADFTWEEVQSCKELLKGMNWRIDERPTRRRRRASSGKQIDMRRLMRANLRYGGELIDLVWKEIKTEQRPLVVLCDISGSMERYSRILLQFVHTISNGLQDVESFVFGTRLTRITRQLQRRDIDEAIQEVSKHVIDWSGGTRIGDSIKEFNYRWARRVLGRGAVVLIISDGWDRGDTTMLSKEMDRLQRSCHRLIWLNPLLGAPGYEPLTRGIQAALPFVDDFLPVHNLIALEQLGAVLAKIGDGKPSRRQHIVAR